MIWLSVFCANDIAAAAQAIPTRNVFFMLLYFCAKSTRNNQFLLSCKTGNSCILFAKHIFQEVKINRLNNIRHKLSSNGIFIISPYIYHKKLRT